MSQLEVRSQAGGRRPPTFTSQPCHMLDAQALDFCNSISHLYRC